MRPLRLAWIAFHVGLIFLSSTAFAGRASEYAFTFYRKLLGLENVNLSSLHLLAEKGVHVTLFFSLGIVILMSLTGRLGRRILWALAACVVVGVMSEGIQAFMPGRDPSLFDVLLNGSSGLLGACIVTLGMASRPSPAAVDAAETQTSQHNL